MSWRDYTGLSEDKDRLTIYIPKQKKQQWTKEADEKSYQSRGEYLYELIEEARAYRRQGFLAHHDSQDELNRLKRQVAELQDQLAKDQQQTSGRVEIGSSEFVSQYLTNTYQPLEEVLRKVVERGALDDLLRKPVEDQLYYLAQKGRVEFKTGHGWKLTDEKGGDE